MGRLSISSQEENISDFGFSFWILEYVHIHNEISWEQNPSLSMKFIYVSYISYTHSWHVILHRILVHLRFDHSSLHEVRYGIYRLCHHVNQCLKIFDFGTLQVLNFHIRDAQPVCCFECLEIQGIYCLLKEIMYVCKYFITISNMHSTIKETQTLSNKRNEE